MFVMMDSGLKYFKRIRKKMLCWDSRVHQPCLRGMCTCALQLLKWRNLGLKYALKYLLVMVKAWIKTNGSNVGNSHDSHPWANPWPKININEPILHCSMHAFSSISTPLPADTIFFPFSILNCFQRLTHKNKHDIDILNNHQSIK